MKRACQAVLVAGFGFVFALSIAAEGLPPRSEQGLRGRPVPAEPEAPSLPGQPGEGGLVPAEALPQASVLPLIRFSGSLEDALGRPRQGTFGITFALYSEQEGGAPLWLETQNVELEAEGRYTVLLGATQSEGLPLEIFSSEEARWIGIQVQGEEEQSRILLVSVPYALKAADAERLGGLPASAFVTTESAASGSSEVSAGGGEASTLSTGGTGTQLLTSGTANFIGKFINTTDLGDSTIFEDPISFNLGAGTTSPLGKLHVQKTGALTELVVGNPSVVANNAADGALRLYGEQSGVVRKVTIQNTGCCLQFQGAADGVNIQFFPSTEASYYGGASLGVYDSTNAKRLYLRHDGTKALISTFGTGAGGIAFRPGTDLTKAFQFTRSAGAGSTPILTIDSVNSRVGIGTSTPSAPLQVVGNGQFSGSVTAASFAGDGSSLTNVGDITAVNTNVGSGLTGGVASGAASLSLLTSCTEGQVLKRLSGAWSCATDNSGGGLGGAGEATRVAFWSSASALGSNANLFWDNVNSRLGIGTITPDAELHVAGGTGTKIRLGSVESIEDGGDNLLEMSPYSLGVFHVFADGNVSVAGNLTVTGVTGTITATNLTVTGTKSAAVTLPDGRVVALYAVESPENWFEDFGSARLAGGVAMVTFEPEFAQTVNTQLDYHVFLTPNGDCRGLYVARKTPAGFEVHELGGGSSNVSFDYRVVVKRRGFEALRLEEVQLAPAEAGSEEQVLQERLQYLRGVPRLRQAAPPAVKP